MEFMNSHGVKFKIENGCLIAFGKNHGKVRTYDNYDLLGNKIGPVVTADITETGFEPINKVSRDTLKAVREFLG